MSPAESAQEVAELQNYILSGPRPRRAAFLAPFVVRRQEHHGKADVAVRLDFFDYRPPTAGLFVQDNWFEFQPLQEAGDFFLGGFVMTVDHKNSAREFPFACGFYCEGLSRGSFPILHQELARNWPKSGLESGVINEKFFH